MHITILPKEFWEIKWDNVYKQSMARSRSSINDRYYFPLFAPFVGFILLQCILTPRETYQQAFLNQSRHKVKNGGMFAQKSGPLEILTECCIKGSIHIILVNQYLHVSLWCDCQYYGIMTMILPVLRLCCKYD